MKLDLTDEEAAALLKELDGLIDGDRYFLSPRQTRFARLYRHHLSATNHHGPLRGRDGEGRAEQSANPPQTAALTAHRRWADNLSV